MENRRSSLKLMVMAALFAAIQTVAILVFRLPIPSTNGYVHLGDSVLYLCAYLLPLPHALGAAAVGGLLADLCVGAAVYALPTAVIKALMALCAAWTFRRFKDIYTAMACGFWLGAVALVAGYFAFELAVWGMAYAVAGLLWNALQGIAAGVVTVPMVVAAKRIARR